MVLFRDFDKFCPGFVIFNLALQFVNNVKAHIKLTGKHTSRRFADMGWKIFNIFDHFEANLPSVEHSLLYNITNCFTPIWPKMYPELKTLEWDILNVDYLIWVSNGRTFDFLLKPFFLGYSREKSKTPFFREYLPFLYKILNGAQNFKFFGF